MGFKAEEEGKKHGMFGLGSKVGINQTWAADPWSQGSQIPLFPGGKVGNAALAKGCCIFHNSTPKFKILPSSSLKAAGISLDLWCPPGHPTNPWLISHPKGLENSRKTPLVPNSRPGFPTPPGIFRRQQQFWSCFVGQDQDNSSISMIQGFFGNILVIINPHSQHFQTLQELLDPGNLSPAAQSHKYGICVSFIPLDWHPEEGKCLIQHFCPGKKSQSQRFWMSGNPLVSKAVIWISGFLF